MEIVKWPPNEMTQANGEAGGTRKVVAVWSKSDLSTGTSERSRLEADHWTTNTHNSAHHFAQVIGRKARSHSDGSQLRAQSTKQLEIFQARIPGGSVQVIRSRTSTSNFWRDSKMWRKDLINRDSESDATVEDDYRPPLLAPLYWPASQDTIPLGHDTLPSFFTHSSQSDSSTALYQPKIARKTPSAPVRIRYLYGHKNPTAAEKQRSEGRKSPCDAQTNYELDDIIANSVEPKDTESDDKWTNVEKRNRKVYLSSSPDLELRSTLAIKKLIEFIRVSVGDQVSATADPTDGFVADDRNSAPRRSPTDDNGFRKNGDNEIETVTPAIAATPQSGAATTADPAEAKKNKKVEFSKTEVHFVAAEPGRIKIVETNEKPPPVNLYRRRKRNGDGRAHKKGVDFERLRRLDAGRRENDEHSDDGDAKNVTKETADDEERMRKLVFAAAAAASTFDKGLTVNISSSKDRNRDSATDSTSWHPTSLNRVTIKAGTSGYITKINFHPQGVTITDDVTTIVPGKRAQYGNAAGETPIATIYIDNVSHFPATEPLNSEWHCKLPGGYVRENGSTGECGYSLSPTTSVAPTKDERDARPDKKSSKTNRGGGRSCRQATDQEITRPCESSSSEHTATGGEMRVSGSATTSSSSTSTTTNRPPAARKRITRVKITKDTADVSEICSDIATAKSSNSENSGSDQNAVSTPQRKSSVGASVSVGEGLNEDRTATPVNHTVSKSSLQNGHSSFSQAFEPSGEDTRSWRRGPGRRHENVEPTAKTRTKNETKFRTADVQPNKSERRPHQLSKCNKRSTAITSKSKPKRLIRQKCATARINIFNIQEKPQKHDDRTKITGSHTHRILVSNKPGFGTL